MFCNIQYKIGFLALLIAISSCREVVHIAFFLWNQGSIEQTLCINKSNKLKKCHGKCLLSKKMKETPPEQNMPVPLKLIKQQFELFMPEQALLSYEVFLLIKSEIRYRMGFLRCDFRWNSFEPPDLACFSFNKH